MINYFFGNNSKLQLMYQDSFNNVTDYKVVIANFTNSEYYVSVDQTTSLNVNMYVRKNFVRGSDKID